MEGEEGMLKLSRYACANSVLCVTLLSFIGMAIVAPAQPKHAVVIEDLETLKRADCVKLSPNGDAVAYVLDGDIWIVEVKKRSAPRHVGNGASLSWSPDGKRLSYSSRQSGTLQLWILDVTTGQINQLTSFSNGIDPNPWAYHLPNTNEPVSQSWSPDSDKLVFTSQVDGADQTNVQKPAVTPTSKSGKPLVLTNKTPPEWTLRGVFSHSDITPEWATWTKGSEPGDSPLLPPMKVSQLFVVDVRTRAVEQLTRDGGMYFNPDWSPNGRQIVCASTDGQALGAETYTPVNIYVIDIATGKKTALTVGSGDRWLPRWSQNGMWVAYWSGPQPWAKHSLGVSSIRGGKPLDVMSQLDRLVYDYEWLPDSQSLVVNYVDGVSWALAAIDLSTGHVRTLVGDSEVMRMYLSVSKSGSLAWQQSDAGSQGVIRVLPVGSRESYVLLDLNPQVHDWTLGEQEVVRWKNYRGDARAGILIKPVGYQQGHRYPVIVDAYPQQGNGFKGTAMSGNQAWASEGYAIFYPNPRCPHFWAAYSATEDQNAAKGPDGWDTAVDDVLSGVDELVHLGVADPDRIGLYGFSNGGGVVNYLVTKTARFKCAVSVAGVYPDWERPMFLDTSSAVDIFAGGITPWDDPEGYIKLSAVYHLHKVATPMLLAVGDEDVHDMLLGTIEMYNGLRRFGRNVTLLRYPGQGHGFTGAALKDFWNRENIFFNGCLEP
jgi:dipeptidyl aminopeptidase/acylaminoacyl peptidase